MRHLATTLAAGLLLFGTSTAAHARPHGEYSERGRQVQFLDRVWNDLSTADTVATPLTSDFARIENAMEEVNVLENNLDRGTYDGRQFDKTIQAVQDVIAMNVTLPDHTLDRLAGDVDQLRSLQTRSAPR